MADNSVLPKRQPPSEERFHGALIAGLSRIAAKIGRGSLADQSHRTTRSLDMLFAGDTGIPSGKGLLDFLCADPTALAEVMALYGVQLAPIQTEASSDLELAAKIGSTLSEYLERLRDGKRCHVDTAVLAVLFRDLIPQMQAIVSEDDRRKGLRVVGK